MEKLQRLISMCKAEVSVTVNSHKVNYESVEQHFKYLASLHKVVVDKVILDGMIERDTIVNVIAYPDTPVGSFSVYHYDINEAIEAIIECIINDRLEQKRRVAIRNMNKS